MQPSERAALRASLSDAAREAVAYRIAHQNPGISLAEANRLALQRAYSSGIIVSAGKPGIPAKSMPF